MFKSNRTNYTFNKLTTNQQNWRVMAETGKAGKSVFSFARGLGRVTAVATPIFIGLDMYDKSTDGDPTTNVTTMDKVDLGVGTAGAVGTVGASVGILSNPVGWVIGIGTGAYFIGRTVYDIDLSTPRKPIVDSPIPNQAKPANAG